MSGKPYVMRGRVTVMNNGLLDTYRVDGHDSMAITQQWLPWIQYITPEDDKLAQTLFVTLYRKIFKKIENLNTRMYKCETRRQQY